MSSKEDNARRFDRNPAILAVRTKSALVDYVEALFRQEGSADALGVDVERLRGFIRKVSRHYRENPYHNFHHAADTVNTVGWMISRPVLKANLPLHYRFLLMLTALIHDVEHPGHNNQWEVQTQSMLAQEYENVAVLEKHSYAVTLRIMADPAYDLFLPFGQDTAERWLRVMEEIVLATDFAVHRQFLDDFRIFMAEHLPDFGNEAFLSWVARAVMKAADIANTSKPFPQARLWGERVMMEFWAQGVMEKQHNLPVGPLNDPETVQLNAAQAGFIRFAAMELFELLSAIDPGLQEMVDNLRSNMQVYEEKARRGDGLFE
ncbi:MAG TPA: 3',5'-cyclic nucleotide phosphodiesterase [bacterium]|nr:3',5'-cyclic nucleotide phosphodiesterase [bacterium]